jgi:hypothetical protein
MKSKSIRLILVCVVCLDWTVAVTATVFDDPKNNVTPDQLFEKLFAAVMKVPEKADWKSLREAFSKTTHYQPYNTEVHDKLTEIRASIGRGETKESEAALLKLLERERFMRFDTLALLMMLYEKTHEAEKAEKYKKSLDGILEVLKYPRAGTSFDNSIQILFIEEEYLVTIDMPINGQGLVINKGHRFDVFELKAVHGKQGKKVYFNIDLTRNAKSILDE